MNNKIIDKIISILSPLRNQYPIEINEITNDLINNKYDSLKYFVNTNFDKIDYSNELKELVSKLVNYKLLDNSYLNIVNTNRKYTSIPFENNNNTILIKSRPLNVKDYVLNKIKLNIPNQILINNNQNNNITPNNTIDDDNKQDISTIRKKILEAQLNYLKDANNFIQLLENEDEEVIYKSIIDLNDIRFIQHSISKLSNNTLNKLLSYVENKINTNNHNSIDRFIIEVIKKNLHKMH